ncbi:MAG: NADAR family protein [Hahellaceae bacterium]|nr:NADAR family protein [Hahellaceae bacterium]
MTSATFKSTQSLVTAIQKGFSAKYLFFWGHQPHKPGAIDKSCFSQWFDAGFTIEDIYYPTAEHYMMAAKARLFGDHDIAEKILRAGHPGEAKKLGREIAGFDEARWQQHRFDIVVTGNLAKFSQNQSLKTFILSTGQRVLVEASPVDSVWGIGLACYAKEACEPEHWPGLNLLGFALMEVRSILI